MKIQAIGGSLNRQKANFKGYFDGEITKGRKNYATYEIVHHGSYSSSSVRVDREVRDIQKVFVPYSWDKESDYPKTAKVPLKYIYVSDMEAMRGKETTFANDVYVSPILTRVQSLEHTNREAKTQIKSAEARKDSAQREKSEAYSEMNGFYLFGAEDKKRRAKYKYDKAVDALKNAEDVLAYLKPKYDAAEKEIAFINNASIKNKLIDVSNLRGDEAITTVMDVVDAKRKNPQDLSWIKDEVVSFPEKTMLLSDLILLALGLQEKEIKELTYNTKAMFISSHIQSSDFTRKVRKAVSKNTI